MLNPDYDNTINDIYIYMKPTHLNEGLVCKTSHTLISKQRFSCILMKGFAVF